MGLCYKSSKPVHSGQLPPARLLLLKFHNFLANSATNCGSSLQTHEPMGTHLSKHNHLFDNLISCGINCRLVSKQDWEGIPNKDWLSGEAPPSEWAVPSGSSARKRSEDQVWLPACMPALCGEGVHAVAGLSLSEHSISGLLMWAEDQQLSRNLLDRPFWELHISYPAHLTL